MKVALVTGGAIRIGAAIVMRLAEAGYAIAVHSHTSTDEAHGLCSTLIEAGVKAVAVTGNLEEPSVPCSLFAAANAVLGPVSLLVNNAAVFEHDELASFDAAQFDRIMAINLRAPLLLVQAFAAQAPKDGSASIVNLIDQRVLKPTPEYLSYALSKAGLWSATRMLAQDLAPLIRVNAVGPGPTLPNTTDGKAGMKREVANIPLLRAVSPREIADAVAYLAEARSVTGQMIAVDGGQHIGWRTPDVVAIEKT